MVYELMPDKSHQMYISPLHYDYHDQLHNNNIIMKSSGNLRKMNNASCEIDSVTQFIICFVPLLANEVHSKYECKEVERESL